MARRLARRGTSRAHRRQAGDSRAADRECESRAGEARAAPLRRAGNAGCEERARRQRGDSEQPECRMESERGRQGSPAVERVQSCQAPRAREDARESSRPGSHARPPAGLEVALGGSLRQLTLLSLPPLLRRHCCTCAGSGRVRPRESQPLGGLLYAALISTSNLSNARAFCANPTAPNIACIGTHVSGVEGSLSRATVPTANNRTLSHLGLLLP